MIVSLSYLYVVFVSMLDINGFAVCMSCTVIPNDALEPRPTPERLALLLSMLCGVDTLYSSTTKYLETKSECGLMCYGCKAAHTGSTLR